MSSIVIDTNVLIDVINGCGDYAEIWSDEAYRAKKAQEDIAAMVAELESFGL